jgi:hypothetical protein
VLKQSSPKSPDQPALLGGGTGGKAKIKSKTKEQALCACSAELHCIVVKRDVHGQNNSISVH